MRFLQAVVAAVTAFILLLKQKCIFAELSPVQMLYNTMQLHCFGSGDPKISKKKPICLRGAAAFDLFHAIPYKKDPKIGMDDNDLDCEPVD